MQVGGWTRLGIAISVVWAGYCAVLTIDDWPDTAAMKRATFGHGKVTVLVELIGHAGPLSPGDSMRQAEAGRVLHELRDTAGKSLDGQLDVMRRIAERPEVGQEVLADSFAEQLQVLDRQQAAAIRPILLRGFLAWLVGTLVLFAAGALTGWVSRGFRQGRGGP